MSDCCTPGYQMTISNELNLLFEMTLQYQAGMAAVTSPEGKIGQYLGSGDGVANGETVWGRVRWDLYEVVGETHCQTNFAGIIETEGGGQIHFEAKGFGMTPDPSKPHEWRMASAVQFNTVDKPYEWLNTILGLWDGQFDMKSYRHYYRVYARS